MIAVTTSLVMAACMLQAAGFLRKDDCFGAAVTCIAMLGLCLWVLPLAWSSVERGLIWIGF